MILAANAGMCQEEKHRDLPGDLKNSEINLIWKEMWKVPSHGKPLEEPKLAPLTEADALRHLTGKWIEMTAEICSDACMVKPWVQLNPDRTYLAADDPFTPKRTCRGMWRVVSDKIVLFARESGGIPNYIFTVGKKVYMLDMMNALHKTELRREKDLAIGKLAWEPWAGQVNTDAGSSPEKVEGKRAKFLCELNSSGPETIPVIVFVTARGNVWAGPEQSFYVESGQGVLGLKPPNGGGAWIQWCDSVLAQPRGGKCTLDMAVDRFEREVDVFNLNRAWWFGSQDTDMSRSLFKRPFINFKTENSTQVKMLRIQVGRGEIQLDMKSPDERRTASATIDLPSKTLTHAALTEAGATREITLPPPAKADAPSKAGTNVPVVPPTMPPGTVTLLAKENQKKWDIKSGEWKFENSALIGSGASEIVYPENLAPPFKLQFEITVLKGMRPRVKFGRFKFANEGSVNTFGIYPAPKDAPLFHYELKTRYRVSISVGLDAVEFYVNGALISKAPGVRDQAAPLKFCAGDNWSKGEVEYRDIVVTQPARPTAPLPQASESSKPARHVLAATPPRTPASRQPAAGPLVVPGEYKEWQSVLILSNEVLRVKLRYMPVFSAADPFPMALELDNRSGGPLKIEQIYVVFRTSRRDTEQPHVSMPRSTVVLSELANGVTTVTGGALWSPLLAAMELTPNACVRVPVTTGGNVRLQDGRRYYFDNVPFEFELRYPVPPVIESMKQQLREGLRTEPRPPSPYREKPAVILSDGTPAILDRASDTDVVDRLDFLVMKEIVDAMTLDDLLAGLKTYKRCRQTIAQLLKRRFPDSPEVLAYYREELPKEHTNAWDDALMPGVWNDEFLKAAVARLEKGNLRWGFSILERHRKEWIGKPDYVARISAAMLKHYPTLASGPQKLPDKELHDWGRAVSDAGATGDRQFIKYFAPALDDKRVIQEPEESSAPRGFATRVCDCALDAILMILDGDTWEAFKKAGIDGWSTDRQAFAAYDRVITDTKKRLEASGLLK